MRRRLAKKQRNRRPYDPSDFSWRDDIADAIHRAVCEFTGSDGFGHCHAYSVAGFGVLNHLYAEPKCWINAGKARIFHDPSDPTLCVEMGTDPMAGDYHCWNVLEGLSGVILVDFAARHYKRYCWCLINCNEWEEVDSGDGGFLLVKRDEPLGPTGGMTWKHPFEPPEFLWCSPDDLPSWLHLVADKHATEAVADCTLQRQSEFTELIKLAVRYCDA
jgi:hypothetical protein